MESKNAPHEKKKEEKEDTSHISSLSSIYNMSNSNSKIGDMIKKDSLLASRVLVAMIGIGNYDKNVMPKLIGVSRDYCNMKYTFNFKRGYHIIYNNSNNETIYLNKRIKKFKNIKDDFKLYWTTKDILEFNGSVKNIVSSDKDYNFDCFIYIISCHGDCDNVIYDSNGNKVKVLTLLKNFDNKHWPSFRNKPKIAVLDFCRGNMRTKRIVNSDFEEKKTKTSSNNNHNNNNHNSTYSKKSNNQTSTNNTNDEDSKNNNNNKNVSDNSNYSSNSGSFIDAFNDFREIYANSDGYLTIDGGNKGGYLIRSFTKIFNYDSFFNKLTLDEIIMQTKKLTNSLLGSVGATVVEDVDRLTYCVKFGNNDSNNESLIVNSSSSDSKNESEIFKVSEIENKDDRQLVSKREMKNPLVVLLCIGKYSKYSNGKLEDVLGAKRDYILSKNCFNYIWGYTIVYMINKNTKNNTNIDSLRIIRNRSKDMKDDFKLKWSGEDIETFNEKIIKKVLNEKKEDYDGLIFILSGHGNSDDSIYDSFGEEYGLAFIFSAFDNKYCKALRGKPKIFIVDTDRGNEDVTIQFAPSPIESETKEKEKEKEAEKGSIDNSMANNSSITNFIQNEDIWNERYYCSEEHFRIIYCNSNGYKKNDLISNRKGSYLIRSFTKTIGNKKSLGMSLTDIIKNTRNTMLILTTKDKEKENDSNKNEKHQTTQVIEDCNKMTYYVSFKLRQHN